MERPGDDDVVLVVPESVDPEAIMAFMEKGEVADGCYIEDLATYMARGRAPDCNCELITCVCDEIRGHRTGCALRSAYLAPIAIDCAAHGLFVCPTCDACTCTAQRPR